MRARRLLLWILFGMLTLGAVVAQFSSHKPYPSCDNSTAKAALAKLYDNRRLLPSVDVSALRLLSDGLKGRYCVATVKWADGSVSEVYYEFYPWGRRYRNISTWIDYNGGMHGPSC